MPKLRITERIASLTISSAPIRIRRTNSGVVELWAADDLALAEGLGFAHAYDRLVQMALVRLAGQGRLSECLRADEAWLRVDLFMRGVGFAYHARREVASLSPAAQALAEAYCRGVNFCLGQRQRPWEFLWLRYRPEPWQPADILLTIKLMSYVGLAQTQQDLEKFIVQSIQAGVDLAKLRSLFRPHLDGLDDGLVDLLHKVHVCQPLVPPEVRFLPSLPRMTGSNNWAVSGRITQTGSPYECHDPHLEINRLPAIWYEFIGHTSDDYRLGISVPGVPGLVMGRNRQVSYGFTYGFMDQVDYFIEDCRGGRCLRGAAYVDCDSRRETVLRRKQRPVEITLRETSHGPLECDVRHPDLPDGYYLSMAWSLDRRGAAESLDALSRLMASTDVPHAQAAVRDFGLSANWVLADRRGNIGYQQSGLAPIRRHGGLFPLPAWEAQNAWQGFVPGEQLRSELNPTSGIIITANEDRNPPHGPRVINLSMGLDRHDRIFELLNTEHRLSLEAMRQAQCDLKSRHAKRFMELLRPLLSTGSPAGRMLLQWDLRYGATSSGATLFEAIYDAIGEEIFGRGCFGGEVWRRLRDETNLVATYFDIFDRCLTSSDEATVRLWFGNEGPEAVLSRILDQVLHSRPAWGWPPWGALRRVVFKNLLLGGRLPRWLRIDRGPIAIEGGRATPVQSAIFQSHGRQTTICPSYRYVTDLAVDVAWTVLAGGPSDRPFSKWYASDLRRWQKYEYKELRP
jgi:penicillin amidase